MNKYELVFDIIELPENYTPWRLHEIMSDPDIREIYVLMCKIKSAKTPLPTIDADREWENFVKKNMPRRRRFLHIPSSRAASILALVGSSIVAVAAGIAVTVAVTTHISSVAEEDPADDEQTESVGKSFFPMADSIVQAVPSQIVFEDETLENILETVACTYGASLHINNTEAAALHLYYRLDPYRPLDEVISGLNTFEQINITLANNNITVD